METLKTLYIYIYRREDKTDARKKKGWKEREENQKKLNSYNLNYNLNYTSFVIIVERKEEQKEKKIIIIKQEERRYI